MDAWEDLEKDIESGAYNPLIYRFGYGADPAGADEAADAGKGGEDPAAFRERIKENVEFNLMMYLAMIAKASDLLELKGNKGIIENIVFMGLLRRTEEALGKSAGSGEMKTAGI